MAKINSYLDIPKNDNAQFQTRNVSIGHGCPHLCNCGRTDGWTRANLNAPPLSGSIKMEGGQVHETKN